MATGLAALGDDGIGPALAQPSRLRDCCCRSYDFRTGPLAPLQKLRIRQTEMETDHLWMIVFNDCAVSFIKWRPSSTSE